MVQQHDWRPFPHTPQREKRNGIHDVHVKDDQVGLTHQGLQLPRPIQQSAHRTVQTVYAAPCACNGIGEFQRDCTVLPGECNGMHIAGIFADPGAATFSRVRRLSSFALRREEWPSADQPLAHGPRSPPCPDRLHPPCEARAPIRHSRRGPYARTPRSSRRLSGGGGFDVTPLRDQSLEFANEALEFGPMLGHQNAAVLPPQGEYGPVKLRVRAAAPPG